MPSYDIATAAFAAGAGHKWVDNLASHYPLPGIGRIRRGVGRDFSFEAIVGLRIARALTQELNLPVWRAVEIATALQEDPSHGITLASGITFTVDVDTAMRDVQQRLLEAVESVPRRRRGRPPQQIGALGPF